MAELLQPVLNRKASAVETYNNIDGEVVNFSPVLRDEQEELMKAIALISCPDNSVIKKLSPPLSLVPS
ncbi:MAG: hypothetical protein WBA93_14290 [Microcoleaceae cyanobacterium]